MGTRTDSMPRWKNSTWINLHNMALIKAKDALAGTESREQKMGALLGLWLDQLDARIRENMKGDRSGGGLTSLFFGIKAFTDMENEARAKFIEEVEAAGYKISLHDSNDDNDYHMYKVGWSEAAK